jgi:hypothetical protein
VLPPPSVEHSFVVIGRSRLGTVVILAMVTAAACSEDDGRATVEPIAAIGTISAPARPVIVDPLPKGWSVESAESWSAADQSVPASSLAGSMQTLYLPPGSTPESGPALVVGQYGEDNGSTLCGENRQTSSRLRGSEMPGGLVRRSGSLINVSGQANADEESYVLGRGVSDDDFFAAARAARFPNDAEAEIPALGLPDGFRKVATARVIPNASNQGETIRLVNADADAYAEIVAYRGDAAADLLTQFWNATVVNQTCRDQARTGLSIGSTSVTVEGSTRDVVDQISKRLTATDAAGYAAFRARTADVPAQSRLTCLTFDPGPDVIIEGTADGARWMVGIAPVGDRGLTCSGVVIDGQYTDLGASGLGPAFAAPGSQGVEVLAGSSLIRDGEVLTTIGGTVPQTARRVVISTEAGVTTQATLTTTGDPPKQYFASFFRHPGGFPTQTTVVAYDAAGKEVGRYVPPPVG